MEGTGSGRSSRRIELVTGVLFAALMVGAAAFYPPFRDGMDGARRAAAALLGMADWAGYYLELDPSVLPGEVSSPQLLFTAASFRGRPARIVDPPVFPGRWSPSGDRFAFTSGRRLLIGDRSGAIRSLGELLDLTPAGPPVWAHDSELVLTMGRAQPEGWWYVRIDPASGLLLDQRALPRHLVIESISPDGRSALAFSSRAPPQPTRASLVLLDLSTGQETMASEIEAFAGWAPNGRLLVRVGGGDRWQLEARDPASSAGEPVAELAASFDVPVGVRGGRIAIVEGGRRRGASAAIWLVGPGAGPVRVATLDAVYEASPSGDGRYVAFSVIEERPGGAHHRSGIVEVATGRVTYACAADCTALRLR